MSQVQIKRGHVFEEKTTFEKILSDERFLNFEKEGYIGKYLPFTVTEKTNLFATLNELPLDLDLYIGKFTYQGKPSYNTKGDFPIAYNSSTNPGKEAESLF